MFDSDDDAGGGGDAPEEAEVVLDKFGNAVPKAVVERRAMQRANAAARTAKATKVGLLLTISALIGIGSVIAVSFSVASWIKVREIATPLFLDSGGTV